MRHSESNGEEPKIKFQRTSEPSSIFDAGIWRMVSENLESVIRQAVPRPVRNWMRSPAKSAEWLWDSLKFSIGSVKTITLPSGQLIVCHPHAYKVAFRSQIADADQRAEFQNFLIHCNEEMFLFDIGAHFGIFSLAAALSRGKAVAVDASPIAARMMRTQLKLNGCEDRIQIVQKSVSDISGSIEMLSSGVFSDGYFRAATGRPHSELTKTEATTIDELTEQFGAPTHLKIDVEGHEAAVLRGGRRTLQSHSPIIFLELHNELIRSDGGDPRTVLLELDGLGYRLCSLDRTPIEQGALLGKSVVRLEASRIER